MSEPSERMVLDQVIARLSREYPGVPGDEVAALVDVGYTRFDGHPIRDFVPLFVERLARTRLSELSGSRAVTL